MVASPALAEQLPEPLPLVLLPDDCMMHQVAVRSLDEQHMPYRLVHSASGVAGLQSMLAAGRRGLPVRVGDRQRHDAARREIPAAAAAGRGVLLTPPMPGEREAVTQAREVLSRQLLM